MYGEYTLQLSEMPRGLFKYDLDIVLISIVPIISFLININKIDRNKVVINNRDRKIRIWSAAIVGLILSLIYLIEPSLLLFPALLGISYISYITIYELIIEVTRKEYKG